LHRREPGVAGTGSEDRRHCTSIGAPARTSSRMTLQPGCRFVVAPHFHLPDNWPRRLLIGTGVEQVNGRFSPRPSWRPPTEDELKVLLQTSIQPEPREELEECIALFPLPGHLGSAWWQLLEHAAGELGSNRLPGFDKFVKQVVEFLAFKYLAV